jgi:ribosome-associated heat shock protein Hsp15
MSALMISSNLTTKNISEKLSSFDGSFFVSGRSWMNKFGWTDANKIRIDKWLWAVRIYKSRSLSAKACEMHKVFILDQKVKPSRLIKAGELIEIRNSGLTRRIEVLQLVEKRMSAKLVSKYYIDHTPPSEIEAYRMRVARAAEYREPGSGRPTKKDRRNLDGFLDAIDDLFEN